MVFFATVVVLSVFAFCGIGLNDATGAIRGALPVDSGRIAVPVWGA